MANIAKLANVKDIKDIAENVGDREMDQIADIEEHKDNSDI